MSKINDYNQYDYQKAFWENQNREYEDGCERQALVKLLRHTKQHFGSMMDIGCGFGRLMDVYSGYADRCYLMDYAENLLKQAKGRVDSGSVLVCRADGYHMPVKPGKIECAISVRTLHHFIDPKAFLAQVHSLLKPSGYFIFEIPNKRHILNILNFFLGRLSVNPFSQDPYYLKETYVNYHPNMIRRLVQEQGFTIIKSVSTSYFRNRLIKKIVPTRFLVMLESIFQNLFSFTDLTPSIYILCRKTGCSSDR